MPYYVDDWTPCHHQSIDHEFRYARRHADITCTYDTNRFPRNVEAHESAEKKVAFADTVVCLMARNSSSVHWLEVMLALSSELTIF